MEIAVEVSLYPLGAESIGAPIREFTAGIERRGVQISTGPMSSVAVGPVDRVFDAVKEAFKQAALERPCVLVAKFSNACPVEPQER